MEANQAEQPKKKGGFWKILHTVLVVLLPIAKILAQDDVLKGTGGDVLKKVDPNILDGIK